MPSPRSAAEPTPTILPSSIATAPHSIGGPPTGSTQPQQRTSPTAQEGLPRPLADDRVLVVDALPEASCRAHPDDPPVLDRDRAALDRRAFDGQHPVRREDLAHGSDRLAASIRGDRRSISTDSQIEPSYRTISGIAS